MWRWSVAGLCALALGLGAREARADKFDQTLDLSLHLSHGWFEANDLGLSTTSDAPGIQAADPFLVGSGRFFATRLRGGLSLDGFRFGLGAGLMTVDALQVQSSEPGLEPGPLWGAPLEAYVGYAFGSARDVRPYLEVRGTMTALQMSLRSDDEDSTSRLLRPGLSGRAGVLVPLSEFFFLDAGVMGGMVGPEKFALDVALGLPIPLANL